MSFKGALPVGRVTMRCGSSDGLMLKAHAEAVAKHLWVLGFSWTRALAALGLSRC